MVETDELSDASAGVGIGYDVGEEDAAVGVDYEVEDIKPKQLKKKRKSSKKGKAGKKIKARLDLAEGSKLSDGGQVDRKLSDEGKVDMGDTVMLERIDDEIEQSNGRVKAG